MNINDWLSEIGKHIWIVAAGSIVLLVFIVVFIRSVRKHPVLSILGFVGCVVVLAGIVIIHDFVRGTIKVRAAQTWPTTSGKIIVSKTEISKILSNERRLTRSTIKSVVITYEYMLPPEKSQSEKPSPKRIYRSSTVQLSRKPNFPQLLGRYPLGKTVIVHYNPRDPGEATLDLESTDYLLSLCMGIGLLIAGTLLFYLAAR